MKKITENLKKTNSYKSALVSDHRFITFPLAWCVRFGLTPEAVVFYEYIKYATINGAWHAYAGSIRGLCALVNCSLPTARKTLELLESKGFISKGDDNNGTSGLPEYRANLLEDKNRTTEEQLDSWAGKYIVKKEREERAKKDPKYAKALLIAKRKAQGRAKTI